ncbi:MAG: hypothetical protein CEN90_216 [Parcubacteria group bacterium Licking1014_17]|nr:MAG: hypothetical protein CEN90_216 [Parcubacteria group bacterium Licking1014_17]
MVSFPSGDDGKIHAEDRVISEVENKNLIDGSSILYCTVEPCSKRATEGMADCVSRIIRSGIKHVVYGARDPMHSQITKQRLKEAGITIKQVSDKNLIKKSAKIFNESAEEPNVIKKPLG